MLKWVRAFNRYDLYSKGAARPNVAGADAVLRRSSCEEFFPEPLRW